jgi:DNA repair protein RecO (recombination protein O)
LRQWLGGNEHFLIDGGDVRAHQRLLREFVREHLADEKPMPAFDIWERDVLTTGQRVSAVAAESVRP